MSEGWHLDPYGRYAQRYHDGSTWTAHVSNQSGVTESDPLGVDPGPGGFPAAPPVTGMPAPQGDPGSGAVPGSPWARIGAAILDGLVVGLPLLVLAFLIFDIELDTENEALGAPLEVTLFLSVGSFLYATLMVGRFGRTLGKMACGLTVVSKGTTTIPSYGAAAVRALVYALYGIPNFGILGLIVAVVMLFAHWLRQTPHDLASGTVVAKTESVPQATATR